MSERQDLAGYCRNCSDAQLWNVYNDEKARARNNPGTATGKTAKVFAQEARKELVRRGLMQEGER